MRAHQSIGGFVLPPIEIAGYRFCGGPCQTIIRKVNAGSGEAA